MTALDTLSTDLTNISGIVNEIIAGTNVQGNLATLQGVMSQTTTDLQAAVTEEADLTNALSTVNQQLAATQAQLAACQAAPPAPVAPQLPAGPTPASPTTPTAPSTAPTTPTTAAATSTSFTPGATAAIGLGAALVGFVAGRMTKK